MLLLLDGGGEDVMSDIASHQNCLFLFLSAWIRSVDLTQHDDVTQKTRLMFDSVHSFHGLMD